MDERKNAKAVPEPVTGEWLAVVEWDPEDKFRVIMIARRCVEAENVAMMLARRGAGTVTIYVRESENRWAEAEEIVSPYSGASVLSGSFASWYDGVAKYLETLAYHCSRWM